MLVVGVILLAAGVWYVRRRWQQNIVRRERNGGVAMAEVGFDDKEKQAPAQVEQKVNYRPDLREWGAS